jgi:hypothetical protein
MALASGTKLGPMKLARHSEPAAWAVYRAADWKRCASQNLLHKRQPVRHSVFENIGVEQHDDSDDNSGVRIPIRAIACQVEVGFEAVFCEQIFQS